jgi:hypothetical protein
MSGGDSPPRSPGPGQPSAPLYPILLFVSFAITVAGIVTMIPAAGASYENVLGYRSVCTFAPAATLFCFLAAGITCTLRATLIKRRALYGKPVVNKAAIGILAATLALALAATAWFIVVKRSYTDTDAESAATQAEES